MERERTSEERLTVNLGLFDLPSGRDPALLVSHDLGHHLSEPNSESDNASDQPKRNEADTDLRTT